MPVVVFTPELLVFHCIVFVTLTISLFFLPLPFYGE